MRFAMCRDGRGDRLDSVLRQVSCDSGMRFIKKAVVVPVVDSTVLEVAGSASASDL